MGWISLVVPVMVSSFVVIAGARGWRLLSTVQSWAFLTLVLIWLVLLAVSLVRLIRPGAPPALRSALLIPLGLGFPLLWGALFPGAKLLMF